MFDLLTHYAPEAVSKAADLDANFLMIQISLLNILGDIIRDSMLILL